MNVVDREIALMGGNMSGGSAQSTAASYMTTPQKQAGVPSQQQGNFNAVDSSMTSQREALLAQQQGGFNNIGGLQAEQQAAYGVATGAVNRTAGVANSTAAPGQDVFSQKLASMANGTFAPDDPSYQWRLQQGQQNVERSAAARGMLGSGNILKELTDYGQGAASQEYAAQFQRMLAGSQNATSQYGQAYNSLAQMLNGQQGIMGEGARLAQLYQGQQGVGIDTMRATAQQGQLGYEQGRLGLAQDELNWNKSRYQQPKGTVYGDLNAQDRLANISKGKDAALDRFGGGGFGGNYDMGSGNYNTPFSPSGSSSGDNFSWWRGSDYSSGDTGYGFSPGTGSMGSGVGAGDLISGGLATSRWDNSGAPSEGFSSGGE